MSLLRYFTAKKTIPPIISSAQTRLSGLLTDLLPLLNDDGVAEIYINAASGISASGRNGFKTIPELQWTPDDMVEFILELAWECKVRLDPFKPYSGGVFPATWPGIFGLETPKFIWRWHAIAPPLAPDGALLVLRRQRFNQLDLSQFHLENFDAPDLARLVNSGTSLIFYGATGSGKTSLLVATLVSFFINDRVGIAETLREIPLLSSSWFRLLEVHPDAGGRGGVHFSRVVAEMMRLSPKYIVLGELRGTEAAMFPEFARSGHGGIMTTIHAGSAEDVKSRLVSLSGISFSNLPPMVGIGVSKSESNAVTARLDYLN